MPEAGKREGLGSWLGLNRATVAVLVVITCLGLSEEIWANFLSLYLEDETQSVYKAVAYVGVISASRNFLEGFGYIIGGSIAQRLGARLALAASAVPMVIGSLILLTTRSPWMIALGAVLMTNWEPLSVPATFDVVGSEVPKNRRTIAFAVQSIQKRLPKVIGPAGGVVAFVIAGYWLNVSLALGFVGLAVVLQLSLMSRMRPKAAGASVPLRLVLRKMPREIRLLLSAEVFIRWGDWFARDFAVLYVFNLLMEQFGWAKQAATEATGGLLILMALTALATYVPIAKWVDRSASPRPFIGTTFLLFALFPISLVFLPKLCGRFGLPVLIGLGLAYVLNGLREIGEPARKALIATAFPAEVRARAVGLYWGLRSFAFFPAPLVAALLWRSIGPDATFIIGGGIGLLGTLWYAITSRAGGVSPGGEAAVG